MDRCYTLSPDKGDLSFSEILRAVWHDLDDLRLDIDENFSQAASFYGTVRNGFKNAGVLDLRTTKVLAIAISFVIILIIGGFSILIFRKQRLPKVTSNGLEKKINCKI